jgi:hypothetical protein
MECKFQWRRLPKFFDTVQQLAEEADAASREL